MDGLALDHTGFELLTDDERVGTRRVLGEADVQVLEHLADRYAGLVAVSTYDPKLAEAGLAEVGRWWRIPVTHGSSAAGWRTCADCRWSTCPVTGRTTGAPGPAVRECRR